MLRCTKLGTLRHLSLFLKYNTAKKLTTCHLLSLVCNESLKTCQTSFKGSARRGTPKQELRVKLLIRIRGLLHLYDIQMEKEDPFCINEPSLDEWCI